MENAFLKNYIKSQAEEKGIPGLKMNKPLAPPNKLGHVGLELEVEGGGLPGAGHLGKITGPKSGSAWTTHADGSLRGGGIEYVMTTPCLAEELPTMVGGLYDTFKLLSSRLTLSNRCSTHVHVNVGGKKINEMTSVIALWTTLEEALINWCGEERTTNHFCLAGKDQERLITLWDDKLSGRKIDVHDGMKYTALNVFAPMQRQSSIEFRCMRADTDPQPIIDWAKFCHGLTDFASRHYTNPQLLASALSERGGTTIFYDVCRSSGVSNKFSEGVLANELNRNFDQMALDGFRRAQSIVLGYPWHEWMELINQVYVPSPFEDAKPKRRADPLRMDPIEAADMLREIARPAPEPRVGRAAAGAARPPLVNPGRRVDPDLPVVFGDGTPTLVSEWDEDGQRVRLRPIDRWIDQWAHNEANISYWYLLRDGSYQGVPRENLRYPWIRNMVVENGEPEADF